MSSKDPNGGVAINQRKLMAMGEKTDAGSLSTARGVSYDGPKGGSGKSTPPKAPKGDGKVVGK